MAPAPVSIAFEMMELQSRCGSRVKQYRGDVVAVFLTCSAERVSRQKTDCEHIEDPQSWMAFWREKQGSDCEQETVSPLVTCRRLEQMESSFV